MKSVTMYFSDHCPFCIKAKNLLDKKNIYCHLINIDNDRRLKREMIEKSKRHTVPQIWIGDQHIGGCDDLYELEFTQQLDNLLDR